MFLIKLLPVAALAVGVSMWDGPQGRPTFLYLEQATVSVPDHTTTNCSFEPIPGLALAYNANVATKALVRLDLSTMVVSGPSTRMEATILIDGVPYTDEFTVSQTGTGQQTGGIEALVQLAQGNHTFEAAWSVNLPCGGTAQIANKQAHLTVLAIG